MGCGDWSSVVVKPIAATGVPGKSKVSGNPSSSVRSRPKGCSTVIEVMPGNAIMLPLSPVDSTRAGVSVASCPTGLKRPFVYFAMFEARAM